MKTLQASDKPGKPGKLGILFEVNYFDLVQILIGVSHALSSLFDHFATFVLIVGILIFIMQLPLYLKGTLIKKLCFKSHL